MVSVVQSRAGVINLRTGDVRVADLGNLLTQPDGTIGARRGVIQLDGPMDPQREAALGAAGVRRLGYLPLDAYIADLSRVSAGALRALGFVTWAGEYRDEWKLVAALLAGGRARPHGRATPS